MSAIPFSNHCCQICSEPALREVSRFREISRVTSDSRVWKPGGRLAVCDVCGTAQKFVDLEWLDEIDQIYSTYSIYHQAGGKEQPIFTGGGEPPQPRSRSILRYLESHARLGPNADVLDFGCGTGSALQTYAAFHPDWNLFGAELSARNLQALKAIPGFKELFNCPPQDISADFDLITLIHALEHVIDPVAVLMHLSRRLKNECTLFVQVPDCWKNPYDLIIADHLTHFNLDTLDAAAQRAGLQVVELTDNVLPKELSLLSRRREVESASQPTRPDPKDAFARVESQIDWLVQQIDRAKTVCDGSSKFGVFGTSISATWLAGILSDRVAYFVDEDLARVGSQYMGRNVLAPDQLPADADVFVPLISSVATNVVSRLSTPTVRFHAPSTFA